MKIVTVIGARPQFIKAAVVSRLLRSSAGSQEILVHTGQHYDDNMSDVFFRELEIPAPDHHLGIGSGPHGQMTGRMLEGIEKILINEKPDAVLVYGDTNSTLAGALAASKLHIPVAHVEAGLRSFNRQMPEEINRVLTDHVSSWLFCPTKNSIENLKREGISADKIHFVGDVMHDAVLHYGEKAEKSSQILGQHQLTRGQFVLATVHRAENTDHPDRLSAIFEGLQRISKHVPVVLPLHPRTRETIKRSKINLEPSQRFKLIDPAGYLDMILLEKNAAAIVTDSGGVQKEAFFFQVPCLTLRDETEWVELVEAGWNQLVSPLSTEAIFESWQKQKRPKTKPCGLYGDGNAASLILKALSVSPPR